MDSFNYKMWRASERAAKAREKIQSWTIVLEAAEKYYAELQEQQKKKNAK